MRRGERVQVRTSKGDTVTLIVWQDTGVGVMLCTPQEFVRAMRDGGEPETVGFPKDQLGETYAD